ncbi:MAG: hypothetical protein AAFU59_04520 [Pseudomonadota bacterium]
MTLDAPLALFGLAVVLTAAYVPTSLAHERPLRGPLLALGGCLVAGLYLEATRPGGVAFAGLAEAWMVALSYVL